MKRPPYSEDICHANGQSNVVARENVDINVGVNLENEICGWVSGTLILWRRPVLFPYCSSFSYDHLTEVTFFLFFFCCCTWWCTNAWHLTSPPSRPPISSPRSAAAETEEKWDRLTPGSSFLYSFKKGASAHVFPWYNSTNHHSWITHWFKFTNNVF